MLGGRDGCESQAHIPHTELATLEATEEGSPLRAAGGPALSSHKEWVLHVNIHQLLEEDITHVEEG